MGIPLVELFSVVLLFTGFYGLITEKSILKSLVSISLMETAVVLFLLSIGYQEGMRPPIGQDMVFVADPLPQALTITAIVIGVAAAAINLTMLISLCRKHGTVQWDAVKAISMEERIN